MRRATSTPSPRTGAPSPAISACSTAYGGANALQDFWLEQIVKRDLLGCQFPYMLQPKASWAFLGILAGAALIYWTLLRAGSPGATQAPASEQMKVTSL